MRIKDELEIIPKELGFEPNIWTHRERERMIFTEKLG
jgi:hypothetical protein